MPQKLNNRIDDTILRLVLNSGQASSIYGELWVGRVYFLDGVNLGAA